MAMDPESVGTAAKFVDGFLGILGALFAAIAGGVSWFYKALAHRISILENTVVRKEDFERYEDRADRTRQELRDGIIALHQKVEKTSGDLENKIDSLIKHLLERK